MVMEAGGTLQLVGVVVVDGDDFSFDCNLG